MFSLKNVERLRGVIATRCIVVKYMLNASRPGWTNECGTGTGRRRELMYKLYSVIISKNGVETD